MPTSESLFTESRIHEPDYEDVCVEGEDTSCRIESLILISRRTFLSWLHFAVVLGGLAVGLLNFGDKVS